MPLDADQAAMDAARAQYDSGAAPSYDPLVCDPTRDQEIAFVFHASDALFGAYERYGSALLVIDGSCRFFAAVEQPMGALVSGMLTGEELRQLNEDLLTAPWPSYDGREIHYDLDGPRITMRRDGFAIRCANGCHFFAPLVPLESSARVWAGRLEKRGTALDGPLEVLTMPHGIGPLSMVVPWTGSSDLAALLSADHLITITEPGDAALLRELRRHAHPGGYGAPLVLQQPGIPPYGVAVLDVLPWDLELFSYHSHLYTYGTQ